MCRLLNFFLEVQTLEIFLAGTFILPFGPPVQFPNCHISIIFPLKQRVLLHSASGQCCCCRGARPQPLRRSPPNRRGISSRLGVAAGDDLPRPALMRLCPTPLQPSPHSFSSLRARNSHAPACRVQSRGGPSDPVGLARGQRSRQSRGGPSGPVGLARGQRSRQSRAGPSDPVGLARGQRSRQQLRGEQVPGPWPPGPAARGRPGLTRAWPRGS